jgi:hypothetical protein
MQPFEVTHLEVKAFERYPTPVEFITYHNVVKESELEGYLRQLITEGIPYVFQGNPLLYEVIRGWLSRKLNVHAKEITLIGSARLGFSMAPVPSFGLPCNKNSDLDLTIVSASLFKKLSETFDLWKSEYETGKKKSKNPREQLLWDENLKRVPLNLNYGFIDSYKIPNIYEISKSINNTLWELSEKLKMTTAYDGPTRISARVYKDWVSFSRQFMINFRHAVSKVDDNYKQLLSTKSVVSKQT